MAMSPRARRSHHLEDLLRLRGLYALRGPRDGRAGLTPDGTLAPLLRYRVTSVMDDAQAAISLGPNDHARWRAAMGMDEPETVEPERAPSVPWGQQQCPGRAAGLGHAHWSECRGKHPGTGEEHTAAQCCHCGQSRP